jgi:tetratricopeptide (TPR) repeat protein
VLHKPTTLTQRLLVLVVGLWALSLALPCFAQEPPAAPPVGGAAQASLEQGISAYQQGRYRAAVEHFKEADRLAPSGRLSFNIALAYDKMNDSPNALAAYRDYLRRVPEAENASDTSVRIAELELALQKSGVQQLSVFSRPRGASVFIDGVVRGATPWTGELPPGRHELLLRMSGHLDEHQEFELPPRHAIDLDVALAPVPPPASSPVAQSQSVPSTPTQDVPAATFENKPRWWTWALFGGSAALLLGAGAFEVARQGAEQDAIDARENPDTWDHYDSMQSRKIMARVLLGMGLVAGGIGGLSLYLDLNDSSEGRHSVAVACDVQTCAAVARGRW